MLTYWRSVSNAGVAGAGYAALPVLGRVSLDLTAILVEATQGSWEGYWAIGCRSTMRCRLPPPKR
ncbi:hypothetical protein [Sphingomonas sp. UYP23]